MTGRVEHIGGASDYAGFLSRKSQLDGEFGFGPSWLPDAMFPFQRDLGSWALR